jgi:hypothetical protein
MFKIKVLFLMLLAGALVTVHARPEYTLVGAWDFESGYSDVSGYEPLYTGTGLGSHTIVYDPNHGSNVVSFTGLGRVNFGPADGSGKLQIRDVVSLACWIYVDPTSTGDWLGIMGRGTGAYRVFLHASAPGFTCLHQYGLTGGSVWPWVGLEDLNGGWMHLGFTYDGDVTRGYLNGELVSELPVEGFDTIEGWKRDLWEWPANFSIGGLVGHSAYLEGMMDDVAVYRGVLDTQDFTDLYNGTKTMQEIVPKPPVGQYAWDNSLIAAYHFEGDVAELSPGPAADGTLMNGAAIISDPVQGNVLYTDSVDPNAPDDFYVDCGIDDKFVLPYDANDANGFTIMAWIRPDDTQSEAWGAIVDNGGIGCRMFYHGGGLIGTVNAGDTPWDEALGQGAWNWMVPDEWYHVAIVFDPHYPDGYNPADPNTWNIPGNPYGDPNDPKNWPGRIWGFIDGVNVFGDPRPDLSINHLRGPIWDTTGLPLTIKTTSGGMRGSIDDVRIYKRPLNQLEVRDIMNQICAPQTVGRDYTGDCTVNLYDFDVLSAKWLNRYDLINFARMVELWLEEDLFWP